VPGGERIVYRLSHPAPDGATALSLTPLEFLERLALLITPPRIHRHRYHGVLAPGGTHRRWVPSSGIRSSRSVVSRTPHRSRPQGSSTPNPPRVRLTEPPSGRRTSSRWAALIARIYDVSCRSSARPVVLP
jgi:hypothetical protein